MCVELIERHIVCPFHLHVFWIGLTIDAWGLGESERGGKGVCERPSSRMIFLSTWV